MSEREYKNAYEALGEERIMQGVPPGLEMKKQSRKRKSKMEKKSISEFEKYWALRRDLSWSILPGKTMWNKKLKQSVFRCTVSQILVQIAPDTKFNPAAIWFEEKRKEALACESVSTNRLSKIDSMRLVETNKKEKEDIVKQVTRIRNKKRDLYSLVKELKSKEARRVLLVELLKNEIDNVDKKKSPKSKVFEILWAIEELGVTNFNAPQPSSKGQIFPDVRDSSLVYDNFANATSLIDKAVKLRHQEKDMIRMQLIDMCDSLPPLSKLTYGFKLDAWQKRSLRWIEEGKSILICAPTSSGKTVLSSFVALSRSKKSSIVSELENDEDVAEDFEESPDAEDCGEELTHDLQDVDYDDSDDSDSEEEDLFDPTAFKNLEFPIPSNKSIAEDRLKRQIFSKASDGTTRVLFVVPTEPLVWQVSSLFSKILKEEGDSETRVAVITDQMEYTPPKKYNVMPQIVVGTPLALETSLSKVRGNSNSFEFYKHASNQLPGGFDRFDWVVYDEVHALDGEEGAALQRLIRSMTCKFLALSATVGNAEELRSWMERVKGDQLAGVECLTVGSRAPLTVVKKVKKPAEPKSIIITKTFNKVKQADGVYSLQKITIDNITKQTTVLELKELVQNIWPDMTTIVQQFVFNGTDLSDDSKSLENYGIFNEEGVVPTLQLNQLVNLISHEIRFINLQRYLWSNNTLKPLNPLAAVESVDFLIDGALNQSSLSFTSKDSYRLWEEISRLYPADAVVQLSPYNFFGANERITLQRTKDFEDHMKIELPKLAALYPAETKELLYHFRLETYNEKFDLCDLVLDLKSKDMLPCLPFHLNAFESIKLFQQLLSGLEYRQKRDFPTYFTDKAKENDRAKKEADNQAKSTGKNAKELEAAQKAGDISTPQDYTIDPYEPHPDYRFVKGLVMTDREFLELSDEMEKNDGFTKRERGTMNEQFGKSQAVLSHALMRGLRRGIGLYINEVSFPAYRRAVQKLAAKGKLAVVISDDSLAFGVNMPFRTCIFCGEMDGQLTPLMAQQMSGRAGRRGLDTQGNLVYAGARSSFIRSLMIGKVSQISGVLKNPKYDTMFLQGMLSTRHVGNSRLENLGGRTLNEYVNNIEIAVEENFSLQHSKKALETLNLIETTEDGSNVRAVENDALLTMVWELRNHQVESIALGRLIPEIYEEMLPISRNLSEKRNPKGILELVPSFFVTMILLCDRHPCKEGDISLEDLPYFKQERNMTHLTKWQSLFESDWNQYPAHLEHLRSDVTPGTPLDSILLRSVIDRNFCFTLTDSVKQELKQRMWSIGTILRIMHNSLWPHSAYFNVLESILRACFNHLKYLNSELVRAQIDFDNLAEFERESRTDNAYQVVPPKEMSLWSDNTSYEEPSIFFNKWNVSILAAVSRMNKMKVNFPTITPDSKNFKDELNKMDKVFHALTPNDKNLIKLLTNFKNDDVAVAVAKCTAARGDNQRNIIGVLSWVCLRARPTIAGKFWAYLKLLFEHDDSLLEQEVISEWFRDVSGEEYAPEETDITSEEHAKLRESSTQFIQWLEEEEEEDSDEEESD
jgi:hypothetical protein